MENYVVVSKVKKLIKERQGFNTSQSFFEPLNSDLVSSLDTAVEHAKKMNRKTVMGRDFSFYKDGPEVTDSLVVASKVKKYIKEKSGLNTSSQVIDQLSHKVESLCLDAIKNAVEQKRKTVMDRDFSSASEAPAAAPSAVTE